MKATKKMLSLVLSIIIVLSTAIPAFATALPGGAPLVNGANTTGISTAPHDGGANFGIAGNDACSITLYKLDIMAFENSKSSDTYKVKYHGNTPTGAEFSNTDVVGYYYATQAAEDYKIKTDVKLGELTALSNITFLIESVSLNANGDATKPNDYTANGVINSYATTDASGYIRWTGLPAGYYRVTEPKNSSASSAFGESGSYIVALPMVDPTDSTKTVSNVYMYPKNIAKSGPNIDKETPIISSVKANIISWKNNAEIPDTLKAWSGKGQKQKYVITDSMSKGLGYVAASLEVYYMNGTNKATLSATADSGTTGDYEVQTSTDSVSGKTTLTINLLAGGFKTLSEAIKIEGNAPMLYVEYDTEVNISLSDFETTIAAVNTSIAQNEVKLNFTNDDGNSYQNSDAPKTYDNLAGLKIIKKDASNGKLLQGAEFKVYTKLLQDGSGKYLDKKGTITENPKEYVVDINSAVKVLNASGNLEDLVLTTDKNGIANYNALQVGTTYYLVETKAPTNYRLYTGIINAEIKTTDERGVVSVTINNYLDNGLTLPSTGGDGIIIFILIGGGLILLAVIIFNATRKRNSAGRED